MKRVMLRHCRIRKAPPASHRGRNLLLLLLFLPVFLLSACRSAAPPPVGVPGTPPPAEPDVPEPPSPRIRLEGEYRGLLWVEAERIAATLRMGMGQPDRFSGRLTTALAFGGDGEGVLNGDWFELTVAYRTSCEGRIRFEGRSSPDGAVLSGTYEASDCTGSIRGDFHFERDAGE